MTYTLRYGHDPTMVSKAEYDTERPALAAYEALRFNRWCELYDNEGRVLRSNLRDGPIVAPGGWND